MPYRSSSLFAFCLISGFSVMAADARGFSANADALVGALSGQAAREKAEVAARIDPTSDVEQGCIFTAVRGYLRLLPAPSEAAPRAFVAASPADSESRGPIARYRPDFGDILIAEPDAAPADLRAALAGEYARYFELSRQNGRDPDELEAAARGVRDWFRANYPSERPSCAMPPEKKERRAHGRKSKRMQPPAAARGGVSPHRAAASEAPAAPEAAASTGASAAKAQAGGRALKSGRAVPDASRPSPETLSSAAKPSLRRIRPARPSFLPPSFAAKTPSPRKAARASPKKKPARIAKDDPPAPSVSASAPAKDAPARGESALKLDPPAESGHAGPVAKAAPRRPPEEPEIPLPRLPDFPPIPLSAAKRPPPAEKNVVRAPIAARPSPRRRRDGIAQALPLPPPPRRLPRHLREPLNPRPHAKKQPRASSAPSGKKTVLGLRRAVENGRNRGRGRGRRNGDRKKEARARADAMRREAGIF